MYLKVLYVFMQYYFVKHNHTGRHRHPGEDIQMYLYISEIHNTVAKSEI